MVISTAGKSIKARGENLGRAPPVDTSKGERYVGRTISGYSGGGGSSETVITDASTNVAPIGTKAEAQQQPQSQKELQKVAQQLQSETQENLFIKLGYTAQGGQYVKREGETTTTVARGQILRETGRKTSTFRPEFVPAMEKSRAEWELKENWKEKQKQAVGSQRPGELASRIVGTKEMSSGAEALFIKRKTELLRESGGEARLSHYPQYLSYRAIIGRQEMGMPLNALSPRISELNFNYSKMPYRYAIGIKGAETLLNIPSDTQKNINIAIEGGLKVGNWVANQPGFKALTKIPYYADVSNKLFLELPRVDYRFNSTESYNTLRQINPANPLAVYQYGTEISKGLANVGAESYDYIRTHGGETVTSTLGAVALTPIAPILTGGKLIRGVTKGLFYGYLGTGALEIGLAKTPEEQERVAGKKLGQIAPFIVVGATGTVLRNRAGSLAKIEERRLVTVNLEESRGKPLATPKEIKFLNKIQLKGSTDTEGILIDLKRLKPEQLNKVMDLQARGVISSDYEISLGEIPKQEVGFTIKRSKNKYDIRQTPEDKKASEKFIKAYQKEGAKTESKLISNQEDLIARENEIKAKMKATGKTAKEIVAEEKSQEELNKLSSEFKTTEKTPRATGTIISGQDPFKDLDLQKRGGFKELYAGNKLQYIVDDEGEIIRGMKPINELILPTIKQITTARIFSGTGRSLQQAGQIGIGLQTLRYTSPLISDTSSYSMNITVTKQTPINIQENKLSSDSQLSTKAENSQILQSVTRVQTRQNQGNQLTQVVSPIVEQQTAIIQKSEQITKQDQITRQKFKTPNIMVPGSTPKTQAYSSIRVPLFSVKVKEGGRYRFLSVGAQPRFKALNLGGRYTDISKGVKFKIIPTGSSLSVSDDPSFLLSRKFANKEGEYIEKKRYRYDSPIERVKRLKLKGGI